MDNMIFEQDDSHFMKMAIRQAMIAYDAGEVPIGCVIVHENKVIGKGYNQVETLRDPTAHAEIIAIGAACNTIENWRLEECTLYVTLEPCPMCAGAILNSRIKKVVFGAYDKRLGGCCSQYDILKGNPINREIEILPGIMHDDCLDLIQSFFFELREKKKLEKSSD